MRAPAPPPTWRMTTGQRMIAANMLPPIPPEAALWAFFEEHRRCGELDGGVEGERLWMACECGARMAHSAGERDRDSLR
jgi:hypothetical protein